MGIAKLYRPGGGFDEYAYRTIGRIEGRGLSGKIVEPWVQTKNTPSMPLHSGLSLIYFAVGSDSHSIIQMRVYEGRRAAYDFDWGHGHGKFAEGTVHVHEWTYRDGSWGRVGRKRYMNNAEIARYGPILRQANPDVKFRPPHR